MKRSIDKYTAKVYAIFADDIDQVKRIFNVNRREPSLLANWPKYAGAATWARVLRYQIDHPKAVLDAAASFLEPGDNEAKVGNSFFPKFYTL